MPVRLRDRIEEIAVATSIRDILGPEGWNSTGIKFSESGPCKLFQTECFWGAVVSIELHGAVTMTTVLGRSAAHLLCLDRVTGETTRQGLRHIWTTGGHAQHYQQRCRVSVSDRGGPNGAAERGIRLDDRPDWQHLHADCHAHLVAGVFESTFRSYEWLVTGMIRVAMATQVAGSMSHFRRVPRDRIRKMVHFDPSPPLEEHA
eukprot:9482104-Pyramimonas_sp.AAC.1